MIVDDEAHVAPLHEAPETRQGGIFFLTEAEHAARARETARGHEDRSARRRRPGLELARTFGWSEPRVVPVRFEAHRTQRRVDRVDVMRQRAEDDAWRRQLLEQLDEARLPYLASRHVARERHLFAHERQLEHLWTPQAEALDQIVARHSRDRASERDERRLPEAPERLRDLRDGGAELVAEGRGHVCFVHDHEADADARARLREVARSKLRGTREDQERPTLGDASESPGSLGGGKAVLESNRCDPELLRPRFERPKRRSTRRDENAGFRDFGAVASATKAASS